VERNRKLAWEAKQHHGYVCQVCAFDFKAHFGELGSTFIVAHHKTPLSKLAVTGPILLSPADDFAVVCANCHAMIHARGAPDTFEAFVAFYGSLHPKAFSEVPPSLNAADSGT
jgi:5-methylcytosine-specific restriction protein A